MGAFPRDDRVRAEVQARPALSSSPDARGCPAGDPYRQVESPGVATRPQPGRDHPLLFGRGAWECHLAPNGVAIIGFSAGGHLASTAATHFDPGKSDSADPIERQS